MRIHRKLPFGLLLFCFLTACNDYLEVVPDNRTQIDTPEKIKELLVSAYPEGIYAPFTEPMSDNFGDKAQGYYYDDDVSSDAYFWKEHFREGWGRQDSPDFYWNACYAAIAAANKALDAIDKLGPTPETKPMKGEALLARAYAHFMLVDLWAKTYNPATAGSDPGIPIVKKPETVVFGDYKRASVKEVFDAIEADIKAGMPLLDDDLFSAGTRKYHFNVKAAHAFAARFYLTKGDWKAVIAHANAVLTGDVASQLKAWNSTSKGTFGKLKINHELPLAYGSASSPANLLITEASSVWAINFFIDRYGLTVSLIKKTLRRANPSGKAWAYKTGSINSVNIEVPKFEKNFIPMSPGSHIGYFYCPFVLFSLEEVLLNRAEAYTMSGNTAGAIADLNTFYSKKVKDFGQRVVTLSDINSFYSDAALLEPLKPFYAIPSSVKPLLQAIVDARRVDFLFEGLRWFDIRRFHLPVEHRSGDNPDPGHQTLQTLAGDSPKHVLQIPNDVLAAGLKKNPR